MSTHPKPFINVVCDENNWGAFLQCFREGYKFSSPERYDPDLLDHHGRPLYFSIIVCTLPRVSSRPLLGCRKSRPLEPGGAPHGQDRILRRREQRMTITFTLTDGPTRSCFLEPSTSAAWPDRMTSLSVGPATIAGSGGSTPTLRTWTADSGSPPTKRLSDHSQSDTIWKHYTERENIYWHGLDPFVFVRFNEPYPWQSSMGGSKVRGGYD